MEQVTDGAVVVAVVQAAKNLFPKSVSGVVTIVVAAVVGAVLAYAKSQNTADLFNGAVTGLAASGVITVASRVGK